MKKILTVFGFFVVATIMTLIVKKTNNKVDNDVEWFGIGA